VIPVAAMKEVILSHDGEALLYQVPDDVADHLREYCEEFACRWLLESPHAAKYRRDFGGGIIGCIFGAPDFIDYLNQWVFPQQPSSLIRGLGCYNYEIPEEYQDRPAFNF